MGHSQAIHDMPLGVQGLGERLASSSEIGPHVAARLDKLKKKKKRIRRRGGKEKVPRAKPYPPPAFSSSPLAPPSQPPPREPLLPTASLSSPPRESLPFRRRRLGSPAAARLEARVGMSAREMDWGRRSWGHGVVASGEDRGGRRAARRWRCLGRNQQPLRLLGLCLDVVFSTRSSSRTWWWWIQPDQGSSCCLLHRIQQIATGKVGARSAGSHIFSFLQNFQRCQTSCGTTTADRIATVGTWEIRFGQREER